MRRQVKDLWRCEGLCQRSGRSPLWYVHRLYNLCSLYATSPVLPLWYIHHIMALVVFLPQVQYFHCGMSLADPGGRTRRPPPPSPPLTKFTPQRSNPGSATVCTASLWLLYYFCHKSIVVKTASVCLLYCFCKCQCFNNEKWFVVLFKTLLVNVR